MRLLLCFSILLGGAVIGLAQLPCSYYKQKAAECRAAAAKENAEAASSPVQSQRDTARQAAQDYLSAAAQYDAKFAACSGQSTATPSQTAPRSSQPSLNQSFNALGNLLQQGLQASQQRDQEARTQRQLDKEAREAETAGQIMGAREADMDAWKKLKSSEPLPSASPTSDAPDTGTTMATAPAAPLAGLLNAPVPSAAESALQPTVAPPLAEGDELKRMEDSLLSGLPGPPPGQASANPAPTSVNNSATPDPAGAAPAKPLTDQEWLSTLDSRNAVDDEIQRKLKAADILEGGTKDNDDHAAEGVKNATLSQVGAGAKAAQGLGEVAVEMPGVPEPVKLTYKAAEAGGAMAGAALQGRTGLEDAANAGDASVNLNKSGALGTPDHSFGPLGKVSDAAGVVVNTQNGVKNAQNGDYLGAMENAGGTVDKGASLLGLEKMSSGAALFAGGVKVVSGVNGVVEGAELKTQVNDYTQGANDGLRARASQLRTEAAALQKQRDYYDSILLAPRP